jgi:hypothetical protein
MSTTQEIVDSYLSLNSTQYAQAPIGATRLATKGNGTNLYGTILTWTATNWEIEFDVVFPTTLVASTNTIIDSPTAANRFNLNIQATTGVIAFAAGAVITLDGVALTSGATAHPIDGAVHKVKITRSTLTEIGVIYCSYSLSNRSSASIFNLRLTDLDTPANSRFYPMDEAYPAANPTAGPKSMDAFITDAVPVAVDTSTPFGLGAFVNNGNGSYTATNDDSGANISWSVPDSTAMYRVTVTAVFTQGSRLKMDSAGLYEIEGNGQHILYICPSVVSLTRVQFARQSTAVTVTLSNITIEKMPNAGTWFNRTAGDVVTVYPGAIKPDEEFFVAIKFEITNNSANGGFNNSFSISTSNGQTRIVGYNPNSNNTFGVSFYNANVKVDEHFPTTNPVRLAQTDGVHTLVYHFKADGSSKTYWDRGTLSQNSVGVARDAALTYLNINGKLTAIGSGNSRPDGDFYYFYLYSSLSEADITALLAGENPENVGTILQGYNLAGDGDEVNGGNALTLYGAFDGEQWQVPPFNSSVADIQKWYLTEAGYSGSLSDMKMQYLKALFPGDFSLNDLQYKYLVSLGYEGSLVDMKAAYLRSLNA